MSGLSLSQRAKYASRAVVLSVISVFGAVLLGGGILGGVPPVTYIFLGIFFTIIIPTLILGILGLKSSHKNQAKIALAITATASVFFLMFAVSGFRNTAAKLMLIQIEKTVQSACTGQVIPGTAAYIPGSSRHPMVAFNASEFSPVSIRWIPRAFWPADLHEVELILCISDEYRENVESCGYTDGTTRIRYQFKRDVILISIFNGEMIAQGTLEGDIPKDCPNANEQGNDSDIKGSKPSITEVERWLTQALVP